MTPWEEIEVFTIIQYLNGGLPIETERDIKPINLDRLFQATDIYHLPHLEFLLNEYMHNKLTTILQDYQGIMADPFIDHTEYTQRILRILLQFWYVAEQHNSPYHIKKKLATEITKRLIPISALQTWKDINRARPDTLHQILLLEASNK